ncbi:hypothetical protein SAZ11_58195 [Streptomyces sp. FXJ1.4098]|nr:hypothetical protein [Streptomyces sp. FXJ1.4098]
MTTVAIGLIAGSVTIYNIAQVSLRQAITPARLQGRMNASVPAEPAGPHTARDAVADSTPRRHR